MNVPQPPATAPPRDIRVLKSTRMFEFDWGDGQPRQVPFHAVRVDCRCAYCVDEHTGRRLLDPASVPADITVTNLELVGNYAIRIHWSDNHASGLFTWPHLRDICQEHPQR